MASRSRADRVPQRKLRSNLPEEQRLGHWEVPDSQSEAGLHDEAKPNASIACDEAFPAGQIFRTALALAALLGAGGATLWWRLRLQPAPLEWQT